MSDFYDWWDMQSLYEGQIEAHMSWDHQQEIIDERDAEIYRLKLLLNKHKEVLDRQNERVKCYIETNAALQQVLQEYRDKEE